MHERKVKHLGENKLMVAGQHDLSQERSCLACCIGFLFEVAGVMDQEKVEIGFLDVPGTTGSVTRRLPDAKLKAFWVPQGSPLGPLIFLYIHPAIGWTWNKQNDQRSSEYKSMGTLYLACNVRKWPRGRGVWLKPN